MTPLHEELHKKKNIYHQYTPNASFLKFLNDITAADMKSYIRDTLENWIEELYPEYSDTLKAKYADKVLYGVAFEYLNTMLWETFPQNTTAELIYKNDPKISIITEDWQREKCTLLGLAFQSTVMQPKELIGEELCKYQPWETHRITPDGNCLYRTLSTLITGSEDNHSEVRATIARFIASEGTNSRQ